MKASEILLRWKHHEKTIELTRDEEHGNVVVHAGSRITYEHVERYEIPVKFTWIRWFRPNPECAGSPGCRLTKDDLEFLKYCDFLQLFEDDWDWEPTPDHFPEDITAFPADDGSWARIELTSLV